MNYEFMQQVAPMLAIPPDEGDSQGSWITPEQGNDQPLYGANGMPLNYIRDQGGPTQYYSPSGTAGLTADSGQMRATARTAPTPIQGLRGLTPDAPLNPAFNIRGRQAAAPQVAPPSNLLTGSAAAGGPVGQRGILTIPGQERQAPPPAQRRPAPTQEEIQRNLPEGVRNPTMGMHGPAMTDSQLENQRMNRIRNSDPRYMGTSEVLDIPPEGRAAPEYNPHAVSDQHRAQPNGANTLFDMFDQAGFRPPQFLLDLVGRGQNGPVPVAAGSTIGEIAGREPITDIRGHTADVQQTGSRQRGGFQRPANAGQWEGRAPEIEAWLRAGNIRLTEGAGYRTGNALGGGHPAGNSIDVPPNELEAAVARIRANPQFANIPMQPTFIRRGQRFGNGVVATADHYHIDFGPAAQR